MENHDFNQFVAQLCAWVAVVIILLVLTTKGKRLLSWTLISLYRFLLKLYDLFTGQNRLAR